ncbi:unnamed protein product [Phytophthora fragariaefolia]|uniref:Unnamed protein product n=1 Tax=Phytophthora fragariaefolia TaxID=1490495 RepID=A0A9W6TT21_9STRA|nr:unnamed protein product [Phytophthora fragariaefolia]
MQFWWFSIIAAVVFCDCASGSSYREITILYDNDSCSSPASVVKLSNSGGYCWSSQADHYAPVCNGNGVSYSVTDCTWYNVGGNDNYGLIQQAFGDSIPYLIVEEYWGYWWWGECATGWWWGDYGLGDVTAYRLDEDCHSGRDGMTATQLTIGDTLTITKYNDANCSSVLSQKEVTWEMATQEQCIDHTRFYLRGPKLAMAARTIFNDMTCSTPTKITFTPKFGCTVSQDPPGSVCGPSGPTQYSMSTCTNDYSAFTETTFGASTAYLAVERYSNSWCGALQSVTVYVADGKCKVNLDEGTSFIVVLNSDGSGTITSYMDLQCSQISGSVEVTKQMVTHYSCVLDSNSCSNGVNGLCSNRYFVGGFGGPPSKGLMTAVSVYDSMSCSQPAATMQFTRELYCIPQLKSLEPVCDDVSGVYSISDCATYGAGGWDSNGLLEQAFGTGTYLLVEEYDSTLGWCSGSDAVAQAAAYFLDEDCHPNRNSTASTRLTLGRSLTITTYDDPFCTVYSTEIDVTWEAAIYGYCLSGNIKVQFRNSLPDLTATAIFESSGCSERPVKLTLSQLFGCSVSGDPVKTVCGPEGSSYFSISSCTRDYNGLAAATFGGNIPYLMVQEFADYSCSLLQNVTVYIADGLCHTNTDDTTSFMATITKEGSATVTTYLDSSCNTVEGITSISKRKLIEQSCTTRSDCTVGGGSCSTRMSYGGLGGSPSGGQLTAIISYEADPSCSQPAEMVAYTHELVCDSQSSYWSQVCENDGDFHYASYCSAYYSVGWDSNNLLDRAFGSNAYLLVEEYDLSFGYCGSSYGVDTVTAYLLNEGCHGSRDGITSYQLTLGHTVVITQYSDPVCTVITSQTEISWRKANRSPCIYHIGSTQATKYYFRGPAPALTAVAVYENSECSGKPVKLRVKQDFVCGANQRPENNTCAVDGSTLFSISSCTYDYSDLTDTLFGINLPYIMVEKFDDYYCGLVQEVNVYTADGSCHSNTDDATSFMATLTPDGSATMTTFSDPTCGAVNNNVTGSKRELLLYSCVNDNTDCGDNEDGMSCSRRISVGGLGGHRSKGQMAFVASYNKTTCPRPASTTIFSRDFVCSRQVDMYSPVCMDNDTVSFVSDCVDYYYGLNWPTYWFLDRAFDWIHPYIVVEEFNGAGITNTNLDISKAYLLDSECHTNHEKTSSTKLSLGMSLKIIEYDDPDCDVVSSETEVTFAEATYHASIEDRMITYLRGPTPALTVVATYADNACSDMPIKLALTQYFDCKGEQDITKAVCQQSNEALYTTSICARDYTGLANSVFGSDKPYVIAEEFSDWSCQTVQNVTVYVADGVCHSNSDGITSFRVILASDMSATISRYTDSKCKNVQASTALRSEIMYYSCIQAYDCIDAARYGCSKRYSVGGLGGSPSYGQMTGITTYSNSSCSYPADTVSITRELVCNPSTDNGTAACEANGDLYSVSRCVNVNDSSNTYRLLDEAFGWRTHLVVEEYDTSIGSCWDQNALAGVAAYLLDEKCHVDSFGTASSKLTVGRSLIINNYDDASCSFLSSQTEVTWSMLMNWQCVNGETKYYLRGPTPDLTVVAFYGDRACIGPPTKLEFARLFGCNADQDPFQSTCTGSGPELYSVSSCTGDHSQFASNAFGNDMPYLIEEKFMDTWCGQLESVTVYPADSSCHTNMDGATSFMASVSVDEQATIIMYSDGFCGDVNTTTSANVGNDTFGPNCIWDSVINADGTTSSYSKRLTVGGLGGSRPMSSKAVTIYYDTSCAESPLQVVVTNELACSPPATSSCRAASTRSSTIFQDQECIDDVIAFAATKFGNIPYLVVENYVNETECGIQLGAVVYRADGECYDSIADGTSFRILSTVGGSVTIATYPTSSCKDSEADYVTIGAKYIGTGKCFQSRLRLYANMTGLLTPANQNPATEIDYQAREDIMFPEWLWEPAPRRVFESS